MGQETGRQAMLKLNNQAQSRPGIEIATKVSTPFAKSPSRQSVENGQRMELAVNNFALIEGKTELKDKYEEEVQDIIYELSQKNSKHSLHGDIQKHRHQQRS